jgi:hypothetical protein
VVKPPLPVELVRFDVRPDGKTALLRWETATEINNAGFEIQQSAGSGQQWQVTGFVPAKGDGTSPATYEFRTGELAPGRYTFRLRQIDVDGQSTLSFARFLTIFSVAFQVTLVLNPVIGEIRISISLVRVAKTELELFDALGQPVGYSITLEVEG